MRLVPVSQVGVTSTVLLDGGPLSLDALEAVARQGAPVALSERAASSLAVGREFVERLATGNEPVYGITTGVGKLKDTLIPMADRVALQRNLVLSHAGGVGPPLAAAAKMMRGRRMRSGLRRPAPRSMVGMSRRWRVQGHCHARGRREVPAEDGAGGHTR